MRSRYYIPLLAGIFIVAGCTQTGRDYQAEARHIHESVFTIDTHIDTPMLMMNENWNIAEEHSVNEKEISRVDLPRMKKGGLDAAFFAVFVGQRERAEESYISVQKEAADMISAVKGMCNTNPSLIRFAATPEEAFLNRQANLLTAFMGLENGFPIARDIENINRYYDAGIRYITLCHTKNNDICDSANDTPEHNGLSEFGKEVVRRMNEMGMLPNCRTLPPNCYGVGTAKMICVKYGVEIS